MKGFFDHPLIKLLGFLTVLIGIWHFIISPYQKRQKFDEIYDRAFSQNKSEWMSSTNYLVSQIPNARLMTRDYDHWRKFTYSWNKHTARMEEFYATLADALLEKSVSPGSTKKKICDHLGTIAKCHVENIEFISSVRGISVSHTGEPAPELSVFGPVVVVPDTTNIEIVLKKTCNLTFEKIRSRLAENRTELTTEQRLQAVRAEIDSVTSEKDFDYEGALTDQLELFVETYASHLTRHGVLRIDAETEAKSELDKALFSEEKVNWTVPGMNTIHDRIHQLISASQRDFDAEIRKLREIESELMGELNE